MEKSDAEKKLARIEEQNRARVREFMARAKEQGKKQISAIISGEAHDTLCRIRDNATQAGKPLSFGQIIEKSLACYTDNLEHVNDNISVNINENVKQAEIIGEPTPVLEPPGAMPDRADKEAYKAWLFNHISALKDSGLTWVEITRQLNADGITSVSGKPFSRGAVDVFYKRELKKHTG